jgi:hypothetical protein
VKDYLGRGSKCKKSGNRTRGCKWFNMQTLIRERFYPISSTSLRHKSENMSITPSSSTAYLEYGNLGDMLKVILHALEYPVGSSLMLYHIKSCNKDVLFVESGILTTVINYILQDKEPPKKWIELKRLTEEYNFVDKIGNDAKSLYIPILELEKNTFNFPTGN